MSLLNSFDTMLGAGLFEAFDNKIGSLVIEVVEGKDLTSTDGSGADPYVVCIVGSKKKKTKIVYNTVNPKWNVGGEVEVFKFGVSKKVKAILFECYDWDKYSTDRRQGLIKIPLDNVLDGKEQDKWYPLEPIKSGDTVTGSLHIKIKYTNKKGTKVPKKKNVYFEAVKAGDFEGLTNILKLHQVDVNQKDDDGYTAIHYAAVGNDPRILLALLKEPSVTLDVVDAQGNTALHRFAAKFPSVANYKELMDAFCVKLPNVDVPNLNGDTALHKACFNAAAPLVVEYLLTKGADPLKVNKLGEMPLHYAIRLGREDVAEVLLLRMPPNTDLTTATKLATDTKNTNIVSLLKKQGREVLVWLAGLGLQKYTMLFVQNEVFMDLIPEVDEAHLVQMGITDQTGRDKILQAAKNIGKEDITPPSPSTSAGRVPLRKEDKTKSKKDLENKLKNVKHTKITQRSTSHWLIAEEELELAEKLGSGTSGSVYRGRYLGQEVAIKVLPTMDPGTLAEFEREFQVISALESPCVVRFYGVSIKNKLCIVMEYCSRGSVHSLLSNDNLDFGWDKFFDFALDTVVAIHTLHSWNPPIMHRDLKSLNLLVDSDWKVKVCDFGLSRFDTNSNLKTLSNLRGTYHYAAPEVYFGEKFTPKSDVFSIGMILWEMVYRVINQVYQQPFGEYPALRMDFQILIALAKKNTRPTIPKTCPTVLAKLIAQCFEKEADARPSTMDVKHVLENLKENYYHNKEEWDQTIQPKA